MTLQLTVKGKREVVAALARELGPVLHARAVVALEEAGAVVVLDAKRRVAGHTWHGTTVEGIGMDYPHARGIGTFIDITSGGPAARTLSGGWYSASGKQPPAEALMPWITERGLASGTERQTKQLAFAMARKIGHGGQRGFSFRPLHYLSYALRYTKSAVLDVMIRRLHW